jgi:hypothetical protein
MSIFFLQNDMLKSMTESNSSINNDSMQAEPQPTVTSTPRGVSPSGDNSKKCYFY